MSIYDKPEVKPAWAEGGDRNDIPTNAEIQEGWPLSNTPPTRQRFNWLLNWLSTGLRYLTQRGIPEWDGEEDYPAGARVQHTDGVSWRALRANTNVEPGTSPSDWVAWGDIDRDNDLSLYTLDGTQRYLKIRNGEASTPGTAIDLFGVGANEDGKLALRVFDPTTGAFVGDALTAEESGGGVIVNMWGNKIYGLGTATSNDGAVNKGQMDAALILYANNYASDDFDLFLNPHGEIQQERSAALAGGGYFADQWYTVTNGTGFAVESGVESAGLSNYNPKNLYIKTTTAKAVLAAGDYVLGGQAFEGFKISRLLYGTAKARGSWIRLRLVADAAATLAFSISNYAGTRSYVHEFAVTAGEADYSFFIPGDTGGSWNAGSSGAAFFNLAYAVGSSAAMRTANVDVWQAGNYYAGPNSSNFLSATTGRIRMTDFSWRPSLVLLPFRTTGYTEQLRECRRYYETSYAFEQGSFPGTTTTGAAMFHTTAGTGGWENIGFIYYKSPKRTDPTMTMYSGLTGAVGMIGTTAYGDKGGVFVNNTRWGCTLRYNGTSPAVLGADSYTHWVANCRM